MGDNQSDNSEDWGSYKRKKEMGHYDECYEYDRKHGTLHDRYTNKVKVDEQPIPPVKTTLTMTNQFTELDVSKFRFRVENGKAKVVLDIDGVPTYTFRLGRKQTNELLQQIIDERDE